MLPNISLGTAAVLIFVGCLAYVMLRGIGRLLVGTAMLAVSTLLAFLTWQKAPELSMTLFDKSVGIITTGLPIAVFVISLILIRVALKWVANPFGGDEESDKESGSGGLSLSKMAFFCSVALIPTVLLLVIAIGFIHHTAAIDDLRHLANKGAMSPESSWSQELRKSIDGVVPKRVLEAIDPFAEKSRLALAKLVTRQQKESELEPAIDPVTGKVIPRAIIVEDAELERLAREQKFGTLLRHPALTKALNDPQVRKLVEGLR